MQVGGLGCLSNRLSIKSLIMNHTNFGIVTSDSDVVLKVKDRSFLIRFMQSLESGVWLEGEKLVTPVLVLSAACNCKRQYNTWRDLPKGSVKCKHGAWIIKYVK